MMILAQMDVVVFPPYSSHIANLRKGQNAHIWRRESSAGALKGFTRITFYF